MTLQDLAKLDGRVYIHLASEELAKQFQRQAEKERFTFRDGAKPSEREMAPIMALNPDLTLNYVGTIGMIAFGSGAKETNGKRLIRVDYIGQAGCVMVCFAICRHLERTVLSKPLVQKNYIYLSIFRDAWENSTYEYPDG